MRILHTSDWHLGQNFMGKSREEKHNSFLSCLIEIIIKKHNTSQNKLSSLASQKISIDSLFLDERFGTLDSDSLELTLNALNQLESSRKMLGLISYVEALKERIPLLIRVMPKGNGMSGLDLN